MAGDCLQDQNKNTTYDIEYEYTTGNKIGDWHQSLALSSIKYEYLLSSDLLNKI